MVLKKKLILLFLLFLITVVILDIRPDKIYNSENPESGHAPSEIWEL